MSCRFIFLALVLVLSACKNLNKESSFEDEHLRWQEERIERLKSKTGWLNLVGLHWLKEGKNTIGSDSSNTIIFPGKAPVHIGNYTLTGGKIHFFPSPGSVVKYDGKPAIEMEITTDKSGNVTLF